MNNAAKPLTIRGRCQRCGKDHTITWENGRWVGDKCRPDAALRVTAMVRVPAPAPKPRPGRRSSPCTREGHRLDSQAEAHLFDRLRACNPTGSIFVHVPYPLPGVSIEGQKVRRFTPDFVLRTEDGALEAHEVKGPRAIDSRDFVLRWGAFQAHYPHLAATLWRCERGRLERVVR